MENLSLRKKTLIFNVLEFLSGEVGASDLSEERKESIEVAIQCLETAYEISSDDRQNLKKVDLLAQIRLNDAGVQQEQALEAERHKNLGNTAMKNGEYEEAVRYYSMAIEANPTNPVYFCNRAAAYSRLENNEEAIKDCKQALILDPTYGKAYGRLGIAYSNLNQWADAVRAYESSLKYDPHNASYQTNLTLARERLFESMVSENAAPPQHRPLDITQFINNEQFLTMAREMMANPDFQNIMSGIMAMSQSGDTNFEALFQAGQNLASRMQDQDPRFVENLRRHFDPNNAPAPGPDPQKRNDEGSSKDGQ
ncbi:small glutamine-rich tetratricopeptide repeat-containing protein alpha-like isoform X1 [Tribolium madens]|uniref:small glutamine-rich tetratricopeptide repeat-containing protein alpha-like isoform X1 n=1 Tax=Tribolium madens TaxID=41895 RepID=UPI001CF73E8C|nr:small glutamine-rich tetratricopeptide repeat-containing protein alpha-like isoform X1 [Tribolium madens]